MEETIAERKETWAVVECCRGLDPSAYLWDEAYLSLDQAKDACQQALDEQGEEIGAETMPIEWKEEGPKRHTGYEDLRDPDTIEYRVVRVSIR